MDNYLVGEKFVKKYYIKVVGIFLILILTVSGRAFAMDEEMNGYGDEEKARQAHEKAASDIIYQNDEWKALYYQNQQIIRLLKDIRESLDFIKVRNGMKMDEKK